VPISYFALTAGTTLPVDEGEREAYIGRKKEGAGGFKFYLNTGNLLSRPAKTLGRR